MHAQQQILAMILLQQLQQLHKQHSKEMAMQIMLITSEVITRARMTLNTLGFFIVTTKFDHQLLYKSIKKLNSSVKSGF